MALRASSTTLGHVSRAVAPSVHHPAGGNRAHSSDAPPERYLEAAVLRTQRGTVTGDAMTNGDRYPAGGAWWCCRRRCRRRRCGCRSAAAADHRRLSLSLPSQGSGAMRTATASPSAPR